MNRNELVDMVKELMQSSPDKRQKLQGAIDEQAQKAMDSLWSGYQEDALGQWLRESLRHDPEDEAFFASLDQRIALYVENQEQSTESAIGQDQTMDRAAYRKAPPTEENVPIPDNPTIRQQIQNTLKDIDASG